jgi:hypothetical protein
MWQALAAALVLASMAGSRPRTEQPTLAFAALRTKRSHFAWYLGLSSVLHLFLVVVLAFTVELLRDSNRELERSKRLYGIYTPLRVSLRIPIYYAARPTTGPSGASVRRSALPHRAKALLLQSTTQLAAVEPNKIPAFPYWIPAVPARPAEKTVTPGQGEPAPAAMPPAQLGMQAPNTVSPSSSVPIASAEPAQSSSGRLSAGNDGGSTIPGFVGEGVGGGSAPLGNGQSLAGGEASPTAAEPIL